MVLLDMVDWLVAQGYGTKVTDLGYGVMPELPNSFSCLYEYPGRATEPNMGKPTMNLEFPGIQGVVRGEPYDYDTPRQKAQDMVTAFAKVANQTISASGISYKAICPKQNVFHMRTDANFRHYFAVNFDVTKGYST